MNLQLAIYLKKDSSDSAIDNEFRELRNQISDLQNDCEIMIDLMELSAEEE